MHDDFAKVLGQEVGEIQLLARWKCGIEACIEELWSCTRSKVALTDQKVNSTAGGEEMRISAYYGLPTAA